MYGRLVWGAARAIQAATSLGDIIQKNNKDISRNLQIASSLTSKKPIINPMPESQAVKTTEPVKPQKLIQMLSREPEEAVEKSSLAQLLIATRGHGHLLTTYPDKLLDSSTKPDSLTVVREESEGQGNNVEEPAKKTQIKFNFVGRDHDQGAYQNLQNRSFDEEFVNTIKTWNDINKRGEYQIAGSLETGGQEFGACAMSGVRVDEFLKRLHELSPDTEKRSLSRGLYGNSTFPLHSEELKFWYGFVKKYGEKVAFKLFDYNTNLNELRKAAHILMEQDSPTEIAIPHSPEESYQPFFEQKVKEAAVFAKRYGAKTLSAKRMVTGLTTEEAIKIADILCQAAIENGIEEVTLHSHGKNSAKALAAFTKRASEYGIAVVSVDVAHDKSGTFPGLNDTYQEMLNVGLDISLSEEQLQAFDDINKNMQKRDKDYEGVRVGGTWSEEDKVLMGMPDGGEAYTVKALDDSFLAQDLKISKENLYDNFVVFYRFTRDIFGNMTSVTPGHKRAETATILAMQNCKDEIQKFAERKGVPVALLKREDYLQLISTLPVEKLYAGLSDEIVDALRNDELPLRLSDETFEFLCKSHMENTLKQKGFAALDDDTKRQIISASASKEEVRKIVTPLVENGTLPEAVLSDVSSGAAYHPLSLIDHSGKRLYTEDAKVKNRIPEYEKKLDEMAKKGIKIGDRDAALAELVLTGDPKYLNASLTVGKRPSAKGLTKTEYNEAVLKYMGKIPSDKKSEKNEVPGLVAEFPRPCLNELYKAASAGELSAPGCLKEELMPDIAPELSCTSATALYTDRVRAA